MVLPSLMSSLMLFASSAASSVVSCCPSIVLFATMSFGLSAGKLALVVASFDMALASGETGGLMFSSFNVNIVVSSTKF